MVIKCPPPMPILCEFMTELHKPVAMAASTAEPPLANISLPTVEPIINDRMYNKKLKKLKKKFFFSSALQKKQIKKIE